LSLDDLLGILTNTPRLLHSCLGLVLNLHPVKMWFASGGGDDTATKLVDLKQLFRQAPKPGNTQAAKLGVTQVTSPQQL
jgi:hypothetical protein